MAIVEYVSKEERKAIRDELSKAFRRGASDEEINEIERRYPIKPCFAMLLKKNMGLEKLLNSKLNLYDAVQEYGEDFLKY